MQHLHIEKIINYVHGQSSDIEKSAVETHLLECAKCLQHKQEFQDLVASVAEDSSFEPPAALVEWGINLFQPMVQAPNVAPVRRRTIAMLVYDTYDQPLLAGVRRVGVPARQLLFRSGNVDVDVKIESSRPNDRISLMGQVLSNEPKFFPNTPVNLESHGVVRFRTTTNGVGEFSFDEVPKDTYHLSVDLPERQIMLFCVHRGNS
jgi:hypothetical protein